MLQSLLVSLPINKMLPGGGMRKISNKFYEGVFNLLNRRLFIANGFSVQWLLSYSGGPNQNIV